MMEWCLVRMWMQRNLICISLRKVLPHLLLILPVILSVDAGYLAVGHREGRWNWKGAVEILLLD